MQLPVSDLLHFKLRPWHPDDAMALVGRIHHVRGRTAVTDISAVTDIGYLPAFNPRPIVAANKSGQPATETWRLVGPTMLPFDVVSPRVRCPPLAAGDIVAVRNVGAYCTCSSKPFMLPRSPCYFIREDGAVLQSRRAETWEDMVATQC